MFGWKKDNDANVPDESGYLEHILLFGIVFTTLQVADLTLTAYGLRNPGIRELNPLYHKDWFVPFKLGMVFPIMFAMHRQPERYRWLTRKAMALIIIMYVVINLNNMYFVLLR